MVLLIYICICPPMFDISRLDIWKVMMSCHLKVLGYKVYLAITKESYLSDSRHIEDNALSLKALRASLDKEYLHVFFTMSLLLQYGAF